MAISFNTGAAASVNTSVSINITIPAGVLAGDVMILGLELFTTDSTQPSVAFSGAGGTWTLIPVTTGANPAVAIGGGIWSYGFAYYRVATAGDPGQVLTITETGSPAGTTWIAVTINSYTGASTSAPIDVAGSANHGQGSQTSPACPAMLTGVANDWAVYLAQAGLPSAATTLTDPGTAREFTVNSAAIAAASSDSNASVGGAGTSIGGSSFVGSTASANGYWWSVFTIGLAPPAAPAVQLLPLGGGRSMLKTAQLWADL